MDKIFYDAVRTNGEFETFTDFASVSKEGKDSLFLVKKEVMPGSCGSYTNYKAEIVDGNEKVCEAAFGGFSILGYEIKGSADSHILVLKYKKIGESTVRERIFKSDIRYNFNDDGYHRVKDEWYEKTVYKSIFEHLDNVSLYGEEAYAKIVELDREAYRNDAKYRWEEYQAKKFSEKTAEFRLCVKELHIPEDWTWFNMDEVKGENVERIFIPSTIREIYKLYKSDFPALKELFCFAATPPVLRNNFWGPNSPVKVYVPKENLQAYLDDEKWSNTFSVIVGF